MNVLPNQRLLIISLSLVLGVDCLREYLTKLPNGAKVPNPCSTSGGTWEGVGHFQAEGGGSRNQFGIDFVKAGWKWTVDLCQTDSDGDGLTNGQELGDPDCVWQPGDIPARQGEITHPGICDPWNAPSCFKKEIPNRGYVTQEAWMKATCKAGKFECPAIDEPGMLNISFTLNATSVPAKETTYMCQVFEIPEGEYHMVAMEPIIDNKNVLHHMVLFGCLDPRMPMIPYPFECGMIPTRYCRDFVSVWSIGLSGVCFHPQMGTKIGTEGYRKVVVQYHWYNPLHTEGYTDSSGMTLFYTPNKREANAGILTTGSIYFVLDPGQKEVEVTSSCTGTCTQNGMMDPIYVTAAWNHMHYSGRQMSIEVRRNNSHHRYITDDRFYSYDSPRLYEFESPIELLPGDELITKCVFNTESKNKTIFFGEETTDEMCLGILSYYPKEHFTNFSLYCLDRLNTISCDPQTYSECPNLFSDYARGTIPRSETILNNCRRFAPCLPECRDAIVDFLRSEKCFQGKYQLLLKGEFLNWYPESRDFLARLASCSAEVDRVLNPQPPGTTEPSVDPNSSTAELKSKMVFLVILAVTVWLFMG